MTRPTSRRIAIAFVAVVVAGTCVALGSWQLRRLDERRALNASIVRNRSAPAVQIERLSPENPRDEYRSVTAHGTYDPAREVLLYGRSLDGRAGHEVVTPLVLEDGSAVLVARGWVPFELQRAPVRGAAPPSGQIDVEGFFVPDEGDGSTVPNAEGVVSKLDIRGIAAGLPYAVVPLAIQLRRQVPSQLGSLPVPVPPPELSEGPHLSYAIQWFSFAAIAIAGGAILIRRELRPTTGAP